MSSAIVVESLRKTYGSTVAVDDVSFGVETGEIFGLVGPNGAGKTTTIECVEGLRTPDRGRIRVLGFDPADDETALRRRIGVQLQESSLPPRIRVHEAVDLFASFYERTTPAGPLLERLGLDEKRRAFFKDLSGGQKQRLFVALALLHEPEVVFLDELTSGLDPHARRSIWELVEGLRERGRTLVLSTHYMDEAERLCDRVGVLARGRLVALDTPAALIAGAGRGRRIVIELAAPVETAPIAALEGVRSVEWMGRQDRPGPFRLAIAGEGDDLVTRALAALHAVGAEIRDVATERASLEDVYLELTSAPPDGDAPPGADATAMPDGSGEEAR